MRRNALTFLVLSALLLTNASYANQNHPVSHQSYESCGLSAGEYLTVLQLISRGYTADNLKQSLPDISPEAQVHVDNLVRMVRNDGLVDSYSTINSEYAACAKQHFDARGLPPQGSREADYHHCAGENKVGYEVAIAALIGASKTEVIKQLQPQQKPGAQSIFMVLESKGRLGMFDSLATKLKRCLAAIP
jgi:hypothetical protein